MASVCVLSVSISSCVFCVLYCVFSVVIVLVFVLFVESVCLCCFLSSALLFRICMIHVIRLSWSSEYRGSIGCS